MSSSVDSGFQFDQFPEFKSARLSFKAINEKDADDLWGIRYNQEVIRYIDRKPTENREAITSFIQYVNQGFDEQQFIFWGVRLLSNEQLIGTICLWHFTDDKREAEIGYEFHPAYWGKGYANESISQIIQLSREELGLVKLEAFTHRKNASSCKVLNKNQFILHPTRVDEDNPDNAIYVLYL